MTNGDGKSQEVDEKTSSNGDSPVPPSAPSKFTNIQLVVFNFLEKPSTNLAISYHLMNLLFIVGSVVIAILSTMQQMQVNANFQRFTYGYDMAILVWFSIEYINRVWSCGAMKKFRGIKGHLSFMKTFNMIIDAVIIISTTITFLVNVERSYFAILRATRFFQVFRILRINHQKEDLGMMFNVFVKHHRELLTCYFAAFILLFSGAYVLYIIEHGEKEVMVNDVASGLYWALITVTSVGYGDLSPVTWTGKMFTGLFALIGCAFFALPAGILGSGFAIQVAKQKNKKKLAKIKNPAALLIQLTWRNHVTKKQKTLNTTNNATWNTFLPNMKNQWPGYYSILPGMNVINAFNQVQNPSWDNNHVANDNFRRNSEINHSGLGKKGNLRSKLPLPVNVINITETPNMIMAHQWQQSSYTLNELARSYQQAKFKCAIQFILRVKYFTTLHNFKRQRYPFVEMTDVGEKNAQWHYETITSLREVRLRSEQLRSEMQILKEDLHNEVRSIAPELLKTLRSKRLRTTIL